MVPSLKEGPLIVRVVDKARSGRAILARFDLKFAVGAKTLAPNATVQLRQAAEHSADTIWAGLRARQFH